MSLRGILEESGLVDWSGVEVEVRSTVVEGHVPTVPAGQDILVPMIAQYIKMESYTIGRELVSQKPTSRDVNGSDTDKYY